MFFDHSKFQGEPFFWVCKQSVFVVVVGVTHPRIQLLPKEVKRHVDDLNSLVWVLLVEDSPELPFFGSNILDQVFIRIRVFTQFCSCLTYRTRLVCRLSWANEGISVRSNPSVNPKRSLEVEFSLVGVWVSLPCCEGEDVNPMYPWLHLEELDTIGQFQSRTVESTLVCFNTTSSGHNFPSVTSFGHLCTPPLLVSSP